MIYTIIIAANIIILLIIAYISSIKKPEIKQLIKLGDDDFVKAILPFARQMRVTEYGRGYNISSLYPVIYRAYKQTEKKARTNVALFEHEKWLYQNLYLLKRFIYSHKRTGFKNLPHINGEVRIISLARFIVNNSLSCLDEKRVQLAMKMIQNEVSLCFEEITSFNDALCYAIIEQIYILAQRILFHNKCKALAQSGYISRKRMASDIYNYYLLKNEKVKKQTTELLDKIGIQPRSIVFNYNISLTESTKMAESLFVSLMNAGQFMPRERALDFHNADAILKEDEGYKNMNLETKLSYFKVIERISDKINISEVLTAKKLLEVASANNMDIGTVLYDYAACLQKAVKSGETFRIKCRDTLRVDKWYILSLTALTVVLTLGVWLWLNSLAAALISIIPIFLISEYLLNNVINSYIPQRTLPQMNYQNIPNEYNTMVVVSEFISSREQAQEAINHLIELRESNVDENIQFALLVDFKKSDTEIHEDDEELIAEFSALKNHENCNVFLRKRTFDGKKYSGHERKRGAIMALNRYLISGKDDEFAFILNKEHKKPVFIMTLDSDNTVITGTIKDMINIITHPYNAKYDLINAHSRYNLFSVNTRFAKRFLSLAGVNAYPMYSGFYYNLLGKDIFCGKGIYRLKAFHNKLEGIFPSKKILSHDILEGAILSTGSGATIFEDAPSSFLAERERRKRWIRGDIQLLPFMFSKWKNDQKQVYRSKMSCFYKHLILKNALSSLRETFILALALLALIANPALWPLVGAIIIAPYVINQFAILQGLKDNLRMRYIGQKSLENLKNLIEDVFMLPYYALGNLALFVGTAYKMATKGNLLEWKTYYHQQKQRDFSAYVREFTYTIVFVALFGLILMLIGVDPLYFFIYGLASYVYQLSLFYKGKPFDEYKYTEAEKNKLRLYAEKTYKYFQLMNMPSGIIGDNFQIKPYKGQALSTSPTNIGFTFIADIAAYYLGFIDKDTVLKNIKNRLQSVNIMPKWHGNLYNWYAIDTFQPRNRFVSSVDSGNLLACLLITKSFLKRLGDKSGHELACKLIDNTDLEALYDYSKGQFYIGYDENAREFTGHYDLLESESRLMGLIFIAQTSRVEHWRKLQRDYTPLYGNTLLSWSGTMFEYLLSDHFIRPPKFSLLYTSSKNAALLQSNTRFKGIWGVSESGYYAFDEELRYQYYAFGLNKLSLKNDLDKGLVSPYSSALALRYLKKEALLNLHRIDKMGALGDYGFYEAIDCDGRIRIIRSHMTHHQGMILMAIANALENDIFCELIEDNPCIRGAMKLLNELKSEFSYGIKKVNDNFRKLQQHKEYFENITKIEYNGKAAILINGTMSVCVDTLGNNFIKYNDIYVNAYRRAYDRPNGGYFYLIDNENNLYSPSYYPLCRDINDYNVTFSDVEITMQNLKWGIKEDICMADGLNAEVRRLSVKNESLNDFKVGYYMDIALSSYDSFNAHPVFNNMFVESMYDEEYKTIIMHKRSMKKDGDIYAGFVIRGLTDIKVETNRFNLLGRNGSEKKPVFFTNENMATEYPSLGDVLEPAVGFIGTFATEERECQLITIIAHSLEELYSAIRMLPDDFYSFAKESSRTKLPCPLLTNKLLGQLLYIPYSNKTLLYVWKNRLQKQFYEITNLKKSILYLYDDTKNQYFVELLNAIRAWKKAGIDIRLIVYYSENFKETQKNHIAEQLKKNYIADYILVEKNKGLAFLFEFAYIVLDAELNCNEIKPLNNILRNIEVQGLESAYKIDDEENCHISSLLSGSGFYCDEGYILSEKPYLPYSNVICDKNGGMVITENGGGFFYFDNSREYKTSRFDFDPVKDEPFEYVLIKDNMNYYRINGGSGQNHKTIYKKGILSHYCRLDNYSCCVSNYIIYEGRAKMCEITINTHGETLVDSELIYTFYPALKWKINRDFIAIDSGDDIISIYNLYNNQACHIKVLYDNGGAVSLDDFHNEETPYFNIQLNKFPCRIYIAVSKDIVLLNSLTAEEIIKAKDESIAKFENIDNIKIKSPVKSLNYLGNALLYQVYSSRICGKCGYYQTGGATGFRDQLQDSLAFLHAKPEITKHQILYSAAHQYEEGDVMHWWHHPKFGIRTRISDDKLYLPYAVSIYVEYTGDYALLDTEIEYLKSPVLNENEESRLEDPPHTDYKDSIRNHCIRAIKSSLRFGEHNLLLLGGGDWNDGLDHAGIEGKGESVALSMFCYDVIMRFLPHCDDETKSFFRQVADKLKDNINRYCYEDGQYKRLYTDDGKWLGAKSSPQYTIDLVAQSFSVLYGIADEDKAKSALNAASALVDDNTGIIKLLSPPLTKENYLGYISSYPQGIRENGGQYTHAAMWYIMALIKMGMTERAFELFQMINPVEKCRLKENNAAYKGEPFVLSGDVYSNIDNKGRMGWSWYTGSAAWAYRLIVEEFYGLKKKNNRLIIQPSLPKKLLGSELVYRYMQSEYVIDYVEGKENKILLDGVPVGEEGIILQDKKRSKITVYCVVNN